MRRNKCLALIVVVNKERIIEQKANQRFLQKDVIAIRVLIKLPAYLQNFKEKLLYIHQNKWKPHINKTDLVNLFPQLIHLNQLQILIREDLTNK